MYTSPIVMSRLAEEVRRDQRAGITCDRPASRATGRPMIEAVPTRVRSRRTVFKLLGGGVVTAIVAGIGGHEVVEAKIYGAR